MDRIGKIMFLAVIMAGILLIIVIFCFLNGSLSRVEMDDNSQMKITETNTVSLELVPEDLLPGNLAAGKKVPPTEFVSADGSAVRLYDILQKSDKNVWLSFDNELSGVDPKTLAAAYDTVWFFIEESDRVDTSGSVFLSDHDNACYELWGLQSLPFDIVLSSEGDVLEYHTGLENSGEIEGMLKRARDGRDVVSFSFIEKQMSNGEGAFFTNTSMRGEPPSGEDVLSESQGLVMLYALKKDDRDLFEKTWTFTKTHLVKNGIAAWYVSSEGITAAVNALLDDLRIYYALTLAGQKWNGVYLEEASAMRSAIKDLCLDKKGRLVDFTDLTSGERSDTISLQYLDLSVLKAMAEVDEDFEQVYKSAETILLDGRISDTFPLYYKSYNYASRSYDTGNLNTAEALYTLWNLSRVGLLPEDARLWLKQKVFAGTLGARYRTNGEVVSGYDFHSTAVYGLTALIAHESGDDEMFEMALRRMERKLILDADSELFGAYAQVGTTIYSFDQLIPLFVNVALDERSELER